MPHVFSAEQCYSRSQQLHVPRSPADGQSALRGDPGVAILGPILLIRPLHSRMAVPVVATRALTVPACASLQEDIEQGKDSFDG